MEVKYAFIINPNAGVKKKINIEEFIISNLPKTVNYEIIIWKDAHDVQSVLSKISIGNFSHVIACGGDGTVNMVASAVVNSPMALGILPLGSGNGLARSNGIPMDLKNALNVIVKGNTKTIDSGTINGNHFFCTAGIGFDALIAHKFATSTKRGFITYFKTSIKEFFNYTPQNYSLQIDDIKLTTDAFLITIANAGQWGNDVYIAPAAKLDDGLFHISILKPFPKFSILSFGIKLITKKVNTFKYMLSHIGRKISIQFKGELVAHYDGEPFIIKEELTIEMHPMSLNIIC